jgi:hypothetical protein
VVVVLILVHCAVVQMLCVVALMSFLIGAKAAKVSHMSSWLG